LGVRWEPKTQVLKDEPGAPHEIGRPDLGDDDARFFALEFLGVGKLAAKKLDELAGARATVGAEDAHAEEEDQEMEDFGVLGWTEGSGGRLLLDLGQEGGEGVVELALDGGSGELLIDDAGRESLVRFGESLESGENIGIGSGRLASGEFGDGEGDGGEKLAVELDGVRSDADIEERSVVGQGAGVLVLIAMSGEKVAAVGGAVDGDFALGAAADRADFFRFGRTKTPGFAFIADWTKHERSPGTNKSSGAKAQSHRTFSCRS